MVWKPFPLSHLGRGGVRSADYSSLRVTRVFLLTVNFTVSACDGARQHETMLFTMDINGHEDDPSRIDLGDRKQHPPFATFTVTRSV